MTDQTANLRNDQAARWLAETPVVDHPRPIIPYLRKTYGLTAKEACEAIRQSEQIRRAA